MGFPRSSGTIGSIQSPKTNFMIIRPLPLPIPQIKLQIADDERNEISLQQKPALWLKAAAARADEPGIRHPQSCNRGPSGSFGCANPHLWHISLAMEKVRADVTIGIFRMSLKDALEAPAAFAAMLCSFLSTSLVSQRAPTMPTRMA